MDTTTSDRKHLRCPGPDPQPRRPARFTVPAGAVDTHCHVIGDDFVAERSYTPAPASGNEYLHMLDATGMTYGVLVQPSVHGSDNSLMLDMLAANPGRLRGVAVVPPDVSDSTLSTLRDAGISGLRMNNVTGGGIGLDHLDRYEAICAEMGWHLQFLTTIAHLQPVASRLSKLSVPFALDHMGGLVIADGLDAPGWKLILSLMSDGAWAKLSGAYRLSAEPSYADTVAFARSLIEAAPERCVWGSDWPQVGFWGRMPNVGTLLDLLGDWAPESNTRNTILTTNAHRLYGFAPSALTTR